MEDFFGKLRILDRSQIKFIAIVMMTLQHFGILFLSDDSDLYALFIVLSRMTVVIMIYFLVQGYNYTHSKKDYFSRLVVFAVISELPYILVNKPEDIFSFFNVIFTFAICFLIIILYDVLDNEYFKWLLITLFVFVSAICDWGVFAPLMTCLFLWSHNNKKKTIAAFVLSALIIEFCVYVDSFGSTGTSYIIKLFSFVSVLVAGFLIVFCYDKNKESSFNFPNKFFYWYYPIHLMFIWIVYSLGQIFHVI